MTAVQGKASVCQVYTVSRTSIAREGRAETLKAWGSRFEQQGAGRRVGGRRTGHPNVCAETIDHLRGQI